MVEVMEINGVLYEFKRRAKYKDEYRYCSNCTIWVRRADLESIDRCPRCNTLLRRGGMRQGAKSYINADAILGPVD
jgi:uncharacterized paraquat-inducible protein A